MDRKMQKDWVKLRFLSQDKPVRSTVRTKFMEIVDVLWFVWNWLYSLWRHSKKMQQKRNWTDRLRRLSRRRRRRQLRLRRRTLNGLKKTFGDEVWKKPKV